VRISVPINLSKPEKKLIKELHKLQKEK
jgi:hypothetical protein